MKKKKENVSHETEEVEETEETETEVITENDYIEVSLPSSIDKKNKISYEKIMMSKDLFIKLVNAIESVLS